MQQARTARTRRTSDAVQLCPDCVALYTIDGDGDGRDAPLGVGCAPWRHLTRHLGVRRHQWGSAHVWTM